MGSVFFQTYVAPAYEDWQSDRQNIRKANHLASELNNVAEHYWKINHQSASNNVGSTLSVTKYRDYLALHVPALGLIRDVADSHKHLFIDRQSAKIKNANDVTTKYIGYGEAWGLRYGGGEIIAATLDNGDIVYFDVFVQEAYEYWKSIFT